MKPPKMRRSTRPSRRRESITICATSHPRASRDDGSYRSRVSGREPESSLAEVQIIDECGRDDTLTHHLERYTVDQTEIPLTSAEESRNRPIVKPEIDPGDVKRRHHITL